MGVTLFIYFFKIVQSYSWVVMPVKKKAQNINRLLGFKLSKCQLNIVKFDISKTRCTRYNIFIGFI
jgi:hypothetical protein